MINIFPENNILKSNKYSNSVSTDLENIISKFDRECYINFYANKVADYLLEEKKLSGLKSDSTLIETVITSLYDKKIYHINREIFISELLTFLFRYSNSLYLHLNKVNYYKSILQGYFYGKEPIVKEFLSQYKISLKLLDFNGFKVKSHVLISFEGGVGDIIEYDIKDRNDMVKLSLYIKENFKNI